MKERIHILVLAALLGTGVLQARQAPPAPSAASPAPQAQPLSTHLNQNLPRWLRFSGEYRTRVEGFQGGGFQTGVDDGYALSRIRLNMRVTPASWMRLQFQGQDAQAFWRNTKPDAAPFEDTMDLRQAFVEFGRAENAGVLLRVGRQELAFGEMRLVGHLNWTNTARSFDAARLTLQNSNYKVDLFSASVVNFREGRSNKSSGGNDLHGAYGSIAKVIPNATVEPYVFWRLARGTRTETGSGGLTSRKVYGARWVGKLPMSFDYNVEMVGQAGSVGTDDIQAMAGHWVLGYTLSKVNKKPRVFAEYNYASGDTTPGDGVQETFDQLYPTGHDKLGLADQVGWKNIHNARAGFEYKPGAKLAITGSYHSWWLASTKDGLYNAAGALLVKVPAGTAGRHVGQEVDIQATYTFNSTLSFAAGYANMFPGTFLKNATPGKQYRLPYAMLTYSF